MTFTDSSIPWGNKLYSMYVIVYSNTFLSLHSFQLNCSEFDEMNKYMDQLCLAAITWIYMHTVKKKKE